MKTGKIKKLTILITILSALAVTALGISLSALFGVFKSIIPEGNPAERTVVEYLDAMSSPRLTTKEAENLIREFWGIVESNLDDKSKFDSNSIIPSEDIIALVDENAQVELLALVKNGDSVWNYYVTDDLSNEQKITLHLMSIAFSEGVRYAGSDPLPKVNGSVTLDGVVGTFDKDKVKTDSELWSEFIPQLFPESLSLEKKNGSWKLSGKNLLKYWKSKL